MCDCFFPQVRYGWVYFKNSSIKPDFLCCTGAMIQRRRHVFKVSSLKSRRWSKVHGAGRSHGWSGWEQREMIRDKQLIGSQWWATVKRLRPDVFSRSTCWLSSWTKLCQWGNKQRSKVFEQKPATLNLETFRHWCQIKWGAESREARPKESTVSQRVYKD